MFPSPLFVTADEVLDPDDWRLVVLEEVAVRKGGRGLFRVGVGTRLRLAVVVGGGGLLKVLISPSVGECRSCKAGERTSEETPREMR